MKIMYVLEGNKVYGLFSDDNGRLITLCSTEDRARKEKADLIRLNIYRDITIRELDIDE